MSKRLIWSYGITTVSSRYNTTLVRTLESLSNAGFTLPHLFIDGELEPSDALSFRMKSEPVVAGITCRKPSVGAFGNWITALWELYCREPQADLYAIFQDDVIAVSCLREYLEECSQVFTGRYVNCYCSPEHDDFFPSDYKGWFAPEKKGQGALALVFSNRTVRTLLSDERLVGHPQSKQGHKRIDGAVFDALSKQGIPEICHSPSLVQHIGDETSIQGNKKRNPSTRFPGEKTSIEEIRYVPK